MFGELERQRDQLSTTVDDLRSFEAAYRQNLAAQLRDQIETLETRSRARRSARTRLSLRRRTEQTSSGQRYGRRRR